MDEETSVDVGYYRNMEDKNWPTHRGAYFCRLGGYVKGHLPPEVVRAIINEFKIMPGVLFVRYNPEKKPNWKIATDFKATQRPKASATCAVFRKYRIPQDKTSLLVIDKNEIDKQTIPNNLKITLGCVTNYTPDKSLLIVYQ